MSTGDPDDHKTWVEDPSTAAGPRSVPVDRYTDRGLLGTGGMSEVRRVHDSLLDRTVAVKTLRPEDQDSATARTRFLREARITAGLQHPGVVPVHELGWDEQGTVWFSMPVVEGRTLDEVLVALHQGDASWPLRRVVDVLYRVVQTLAYAHHEGFVHRDVKPTNIMVGRFGEVRLLDWGIATRAEVHMSLARRYKATGTPSYMSPEQASGSAPAPAADVYAAGAVLYELLTGSPPFEGDRTTVLTRLRAEPPAPPRTTLADADSRLAEICSWAMGRDPLHRPAAAELGQALRDWIDGSHAREHALGCVDRYRASRREQTRHQTLADEDRARATELLAAMPAWAPEQDKAAAWARQDSAVAHDTAATAARLDAEGQLQAAFTHVPHLPEAHAALAEQHAETHRAAEAEGDPTLAQEAEQRLRTQLDHLPADHPQQLALSSYLRGDGQLSLAADCPGVRATVQRYVERNRRLIPAPPEDLGLLPLVEHSLPMGSYRIVLSRGGGPEVAYPLWIRRQAHWDGGVVHMPAPDEIDPDACFVPGGPFLCGASSQVENALPPRQVDVPDFAMGRFPVTNAQFIRFLDALVADGRRDEALALAPRERAGTAAQAGPLIYRFDGQRFHLQPDVDGDLWEPDWPVVNIATPSCEAYAAWLTEQTGRRWRLPTELEWEKAARGVDGRPYPWGHHVDASWCACKESHHKTPLAQPVASFPVDESVYGVRGTAGNVRERTSTRYLQPHSKLDRLLLVERGTNWLTPMDKVHVCARSGAPATHRFTLLGFRLAHDVGQQTSCSSPTL